jgi:hypothetical protein
MSMDLQTQATISAGIAGAPGDPAEEPHGFPAVPPDSPHPEAILRTLLYYDLWAHPLTAAELALFLPLRMEDGSTLEGGLQEALAAGIVHTAGGFYFPAHRDSTVAIQRARKERRAIRYWPVARLFMHLIKRCPFVRSVMVSGELSKNVWSDGGDIDFFILTAPRRLWLTRSLLVLFKKTVLFNRKKFFCLNYFATTDGLLEADRNIYVATEVAHVKPLYASRPYLQYLEHNRWIDGFFPNLVPACLPAPRVSERRSALQGILEAALSVLPLDTLDQRLEKMWVGVWARRYAHLSDQTRQRAFTSTGTVSRAYAGDFQEKILTEYRSRLNLYGLT